MKTKKRKKKEFVNYCIEMIANNAEKIDYFESIYIAEVENEKYVMNLEDIMNYFIDHYCESVPEYWFEIEHDSSEFEKLFNYFAWDFEFVNSCIAKIEIDNTRKKFNKQKYLLLKSFKPDIKNILKFFKTGPDGFDNVVFVNRYVKNGLSYLHVSSFLSMLGNYEIKIEFTDYDCYSDSEDDCDYEDEAFIMITDLPLTVFSEYINSSCTNDYIELYDSN